MSLPERNHSSVSHLKDARLGYPQVEVDMAAEWRCPECHKLLFKGKVSPGTSIEIPCPRCTKSKGTLVKRRFGFR